MPPLFKEHREGQRVYALQKDIWASRIRIFHQSQNMASKSGLTPAPSRVV